MASGENPAPTPDRPTHSGATGWEALIPLDWNRLRELSNEPVPNHLKRWWFSLGGTPAYLFLIQITTGILLLFYYQPNAAVAYESVARLTHEINYGWFIRSIHKWSANLMILTVILHMLRVFFTRSYRHPRELNWVFGVTLLLMTLSFGFTGYSLVYEQLSFWGATVAANLTDSVPIVGPPLATFIRGGPDIGPQTLTRLYLLHIAILPALMIGLLGLHLTFIRLHGVTEDEFESTSTTKKVAGGTAVAGVLAAATAAGALLSIYAAFTGHIFDLVGHEFGVGTSRYVLLAIGAFLAAGAVGLWKRRLPGLLIFFTGAMLVAAKLVRDILLGEAEDASKLTIGVVVIGALVLIGVVFHRVFGDKPEEENAPKHFNFFPDHALTELMIGTGLLGLLTLLSLVFPAELGEKANPLVTPEHIKPEWYFYFQFRVLKLTSLTVSVALTGVMLTVLFLWPWIDRFLERIAPKKELPVYVGIVGFLVFLVFTVWEAMVP